MTFQNIHPEQLNDILLNRSVKVTPWRLTIEVLNREIDQFKRPLL